MAIPNPGITEIGRYFIGGQLDEVGRFAPYSDNPVTEDGRFIFTTVSVEDPLDELCFLNNGWQICIPKFLDMP